MSYRPLPDRSDLPCSVDGCTTPRVTGSASSYCSRHRYAFRSHGHPLEAPVKIGTVREAEKDIRRILGHLPRASFGDLPAFAKRYTTPFVDYLTAESEGRSDGSNRNAKAAAELLLRVFNEVEPLPILVRLAAMYELKRTRPYLFRSEEAFRVQTLRAVRKTTSVASGVWWSQKLQRNRQVVRVPVLKVQAIAAGWLVDLATPFVSQTNALADQYGSLDRINSRLASDLFAPLRERVRVQHAKAERRLEIARRLACEV